MYDGDCEEESLMLEEDIQPQKATIIQQQSNLARLPTEGQVAIPAVLRPGGNGASTYEMRSLGDEQHASTSRGISHRGNSFNLCHVIGS